MSVNLSPFFGVAGQFLDNSGNPLSGGKLYTYIAVTTTDAATYTSSAATQAHTNPIILDSAGRVPSGEIWLTDNISYKFVLKTSADVLIGTYDNINGINSNFLNYSVQNEVQTATAGQTVFTLSSVTYTPGTSTLSVFVDGVNQYNGASYSFVETDSTTVTFASGLTVGALVKFTTAVGLSVGTTSSDLVSYTPAGSSLLTGQATNVKTALDKLSNSDNGSSFSGFTQGGSDAINRTVDDKIKEQLATTDYSSAATDMGDAANQAIAYLATLYSPSALVGIRGGAITLPLKEFPSATPIDLERHSSGTSSLSVYGQGQLTSVLNLTGAPAFTDGFTGGTNGQTFGELANFGVVNAPRSSLRMDKYSRVTYKNIYSGDTGADGFYFGNGFVAVHEKLTSTNSAANGFNYTSTLQHTSHVINSGYAFGNAGVGWVFGNMNYSVANALGSDNNTLYGYSIVKADGFVLNGCGAEENQRSAFAVLSSTAGGATKHTTINNAFAYHNNVSAAGYPNLLYALAQDGEDAHIRISKSKSIPSVGDTTQDIIADGLGAEVQIDDCEMPNGWLAQNDAYIHWVHKTLVVRNKTVPLATATPICAFRSTQGFTSGYFQGKVTVCVSNASPDTAVRNNAIYELLICNSISIGQEVIEITKAGQVTGGSASAPAFSWSMSSSELVATPLTSVGGIPFWFEIDTASQIVALPI